MCRELAWSVTPLKFGYPFNTSPSGIESCLYTVSADLVFISGSDMFPGESPKESPETVYATRILLRKHLYEAQKHAPTDLDTTGGVDEEDLKYLTETASCQVKILEDWRSGLPSDLGWEDKEFPSTDPLRASLRAEYYNGMATLLRPYLEIALHYKCFPLTTDELSACQQGLIKVVHLWVQGALASIIAFDRIGAVADSAYETYQITSNSPVMLSNPMNTLYAQVAPSFTFPH